MTRDRAQGPQLASSAQRLGQEGRALRLTRAFEANLRSQSVLIYLEHS